MENRYGSINTATDVTKTFQFFKGGLKMRKKLLAVILSAAMAAALLAGCGSTPDASDETAASDSGETATADNSGVQEITWMFWDDLTATEDLISKGYAETIERFNADYEGQYHEIGRAHV